MGAVTASMDESRMSESNDTTSDILYVTEEDGDMHPPTSHGMPRPKALNVDRLTIGHGAVMLHNSFYLARNIAPMTMSTMIALAQPPPPPTRGSNLVLVTLPARAP